MEINDEIIKKMVSIRKMSVLDPECFFLICKEQGLLAIRLEHKEELNDASLQEHNVGYYKAGKYFPIKK